MAHVELLVEVRQFSAGILEKEPAAEGQCHAEKIRGEKRDKNYDGCSVRVVQDSSVTGHELQLIEEPKAVAQQENDGEQKGIRDHREFLTVGNGFSATVFGFGERTENAAERRPS
jgi:hypothetical protein